MKTLKIIGVILLTLVVIIIAAGLILPKNFQVERSTQIDATPSAVYQHINSLQAMEEWSPWAEMDSTMTSEFEGDQGAIGSKYTWKGNKDVGAGSQELIALEENKSSEVLLTFLEPWESTANAYVNLEESEGGTKATWSFKTKVAFPFNIMMAFKSMDKAVGPDFEKGLANLKALAETAVPDLTVQVTEMPAKTYLGKRGTKNMSEIGAFLGEHLPALFVAAQTAQLEITGQPSGVYFSWDEATGSTDMMAAVPIAKQKGKMDGYEVYKVAAGTFLVIDFYGPYEAVGAAHEKMETYMQENGYVSRGDVAIEEYVTDPTTVSDPSQVLTKVMYPVELAKPQ